MLSFFEMCHLLENNDNKLNESDISPETQKRMTDILNKIKNKKVTVDPPAMPSATDSSSKAPAIPPKPLMSKSEVPTKADPMGSKPAIPPKPIRFTGGTSPEQASLQGVKEPMQSKASKNSLTQREFNRINANLNGGSAEGAEDDDIKRRQGSFHLNHSRGFNGYLNGSVTARWLTRFALKFLKIPFQFYDSKKPIGNPNEVPDDYLKQFEGGKFQITIQDHPIGTEGGIYVPEVLIHPRDFDRLEKWVGRLTNTFTGKGENWEEINKGKPVTYRDFLIFDSMKDGSTGGEKEMSILARALRFEKNLLNPQIVDKWTTIRELAEMLSEVTLKGGLELPQDDVEVVIHMIKAAQKGGFNFFEIKGSSLNADTPILVKGIHGGSERRDQEEDRDVNNIIRGSARDRIAQQFATKKESADLSNLSDLMDLMEYWQF